MGRSSDLVCLVSFVVFGRCPGPAEQFSWLQLMRLFTSGNENSESAGENGAGMVCFFFHDQRWKGSMLRWPKSWVGEAGLVFGWMYWQLFDQDGRDVLYIPAFHSAGITDKH